MKSVLLMVFGAATAAAQSSAVSWMGQGIGVITRATPTAERRSLTEGYLTQPLVMARATRGALAVDGTINFEGLTIDRGELTMGAYGEGYVDRRHPHTYLHELVATATMTRPRYALSASAGRGFVPFGSDDPMIRPIVKYPVNHHLAQVLERLVAIGAARVGDLTLEGATFGGDEPTSAGGAPRFERFGDSWAARLTWMPSPSLETAASYAFVKSPEIARGGGHDQHKTSVVTRWSSTPMGMDRSRYAMAEWAYTGEGTSRFKTPLHSVLAEFAECRAGYRVAARLESTDRLEEERLIDGFHTPRPPADASNLGTTRWQIATISASTAAGSVGPFRLAPFFETSAGRPRAMDRAAIFDPESYYGSSTLWSLSVGARIRVGHAHDRMGRYGVAVRSAAPALGAEHAMHDMSSMTHSTSNRCAE